MRMRLLFSVLMPVVLVAIHAMGGNQAQGLSRPPGSPRTARVAETTKNEKQVALEVRFVTQVVDEVTGCDWECSESKPADGVKQVVRRDKAKVVVEDGTTGITPGAMFFTEAGLAKWIEVVQADPTTNILQSPKHTVFSGQVTHQEIGDEQVYVTGVNIKPDAKGNLVMVPQTEKHWVGTKLDMVPVVSADNRSVRLTIKGTYKTTQADPVAMVPVTVPVSGVKGFQKGEVVPFTQMIQQPRFCGSEFEKTVVLPDGKTVIAHTWRVTREVNKKITTPVVGEIPYLQDLFTKTVPCQRTENVVMLVTPRIICDETDEVVVNPVMVPTNKVVTIQGVKPTPRMVASVEEQEPASEDSSCPGCKNLHSAQLTTLLSQYQKACAQGNKAEATRCAVQALAIDPTCFQTSSKGCCPVSTTPILTAPRIPASH